jgi:hypothetical protein
MSELNFTRSAQLQSSSAIRPHPRRSPPRAQDARVDNGRTRRGQGSSPRALSQTSDCHTADRSIKPERTKE